MTNSELPEADRTEEEPPAAQEGEDGADEATIPRFVTTLAPVEHQVGGHVIAALQHPSTVAVLTSVAMGGDGQQRIVSVGLDEELLAQVQDLMVHGDDERTERVPCVGFHCRVQDRDGGGDTKPTGPEAR